MSKKATRDQRNPRVPLDKPPFGDPPLARLCSDCHLWYPWYAFGRRGGHYARCLVCREQTGWTKPAKPERQLPVTSPQDDFVREVIAMRKEHVSE